MLLFSPSAKKEVWPRRRLVSVHWVGVRANWATVIQLASIVARKSDLKEEGLWFGTGEEGLSYIES